MLTGKRLYLRLMEERDVPLKVKWFNDPTVRRTLNVEAPISEIGTRQWLSKVALDPTRKDFVMCLHETDRVIGYIGLVNINLLHSRAESYLGIGEPDCWGKGYATEAKELLITHTFEELGLNRLYSYVWAENDAMIKVNTKLNFRLEGRLKQNAYSHGEYRDQVVMGLVKDDYRRAENNE